MATSTLTLFRAYQKAMFWRGFYREGRRTTFGIGVDTDRYALQFQRYDRQVGKLEKRIAERLSALEARVAEMEDTERWVPTRQPTDEEFEALPDWVEVDECFLWPRANGEDYRFPAIAAVRRAP